MNSHAMMSPARLQIFILTWLPRIPFIFPWLPTNPVNEMASMIKWQNELEYRTTTASNCTEIIGIEAGEIVSPCLKVY